MADKTVVVTGASGFIGKHIVKTLLDHGYVVRGSVRSDAKAHETRAAVGPDGLDRLSFVQLDLAKDDGWIEALQGADALLHAASPFPLGSPKDPEELIRPAVDGTLRALRAAKATGVRRVVVTSSSVAIYNDTLRSDQTVLDHTNWSPTRSPLTSAYDDSKTLAERAAWDFVRDEVPEIKLSTVNPGMVWGAPLDTKYGTSLELIERLYRGSDPMLPDLSLPVVDVLEVAEMHRLSLEVGAAAGQRLPTAAGALTMIETAKILNEALPGSKATTRQAPSWLIRIMARFMSDMKAMAPRLARSGLVSSAHSEDVLGVKLTSAADAAINAGKFVAAQS